MSWLLVYRIVEWGLCLLMVPVILRRRFAPVTSLAWLSIIFFLPELGLIIYLLIGDNRLGRRRVRMHGKMIASMRADQRLAYLRDHSDPPQLNAAHRPVILQAEQISGMGILGGNHVDLLAEPNQMVDRLVADIDAAQHHVHLLFYIFAPDATGRRVIESLIAAAQRGVKCRVLADAVGSRQLFGFRQRGLIHQLQDHGVQVQRALPASPLRRRLARLDLRNHRKLVVIDGQVAYTGSQNIVDANYGRRRTSPWIDLSGRFIGPIVGQLQAVFLEDWVFETDQTLEDEDIFPRLESAGPMYAQTVPTGPTQESIALLRVTIAAINAAQRKVLITSPYFVPDEPMMLALLMAADRGVEVNIVVPSRSDHPLVSAAGRAYFDTLLDAGVHIHQHTKGMLHAKTITVDDGFALLGSSNFDVRSFYLNFEINVLLYGQEITQKVRFAQMRYLSESTPINRDQWHRRPALQRFTDRVASLLSPLL